MNEHLSQPHQRQLAALYRLMAPLMAAGVLFTGLALTLFTGHPVGGWLTVTVFLAASLFIGHPRRLLAFFIALVAIHFTLKSLNPNWLLALADKFLAVLLLGVVWMHFIKNRDDRRDLRWFNRLLFLFMGLAAASALVNRVAPIQVLRFFLTYGSFIPAFYAAYYFMRPDAADARSAVKFLLVLFGIQLGLNLGWFAGVNPLPNHAALISQVDFSIGTLGTQNATAYFSTAVLFVFFALFHSVESLKTRFGAAAGGLVALLQLIFTFTFHVFPPMAALLMFQAWYGVKELRYKIAMIGLACLLIVGFAYVKSNPRLSRTFNIDADEIMTLPVFRQRWHQMWRSNKGQAYYNIFVLSRRDMPAWYLGAGPGNFASGIGIVHRSVMAEKYVNYIYLTYSGRMEMAGGSITQHIVTGLSAIYSEFGPGGFLLFFGLHFFAAGHVFRLVRRDAYRSPVRRALAEAFVPTMLLYLGLNLLSDFLSDTFLQVGVWTWAGLVWKPDAPDLLQEVGEQIDFESLHPLAARPRPDNSP